jgi:hypothetical protein
MEKQKKSEDDEKRTSFRYGLLKSLIGVPIVLTIFGGAFSPAKAYQVGCSLDVPANYSVFVSTLATLPEALNKIQVQPSKTSFEDNLDAALGGDRSLDVPANYSVFVSTLATLPEALNNLRVQSADLDSFGWGVTGPAGGQLSGQGYNGMISTPIGSFTAPSAP